jgi:hypothetical protein
MKRVRIERLSLTAILAAMVCLLLAVPSARGQGFTLQVTERTNDVLNLFNGAPHPGFLQLDPGPGGLPNALTFTTPVGLVAGDLVLQEPGGGISDLIRWNANNATLVFYSDIETSDLPPFDSADIGLPTAFYPNVFSVTETGLFGQPYSETGPNGYVYVPAVGQPGYDPSNTPGNQPTYTIISDVPEPGTVALVGLSLVGALAVIRRKK